MYILAIRCIGSIEEEHHSPHVQHGGPFLLCKFLSKHVVMLVDLDHTMRQ